MRVKTTISMAPEILEYILSESESMGMTKSGVIVMAVNQYRQTKQALNDIGKLQNIVNQLKTLPVAKDNKNSVKGEK